MISKLKWNWLDWLIVIVIALVILFVVAYNSGLAIYIRGALHLLAGVLLWAGNALNAVGR
jgi:hypothetical protein